VRGWFRRLPIHQKLVALALVVTGFALGLAMLALAVFDIWRYRQTATEEVAALAGVLAENTAASVAFDEPDSAAEVLGSVRVRDVVVKACIYLPNGRLFAGYARQRESPCADRQFLTPSWSRLEAAAPIVKNARSLGTVYVERDLSDLSRRLNVTALVGVLVFLAAAVSAYLISRRIHASIAGPISALASFATRFSSDTAADLPDLQTAPDEVGDLSAAFTEMIGRVRLATQDAQEALRREREANRLKDEFLAAVSHELRTPLNAMMGWAQVLGVGEPSNETVRQAASSIVKNAHAQTRVIEDLIDVSRIATGKMRLAIEHVDLRTVVALAADTIQPVAVAKGVRLERRAPDAPCHVMGDRDRLVQILWNLLSNAVKFTPRGGLVTISVVRQGSLVVANVADTGAGIDAAFLPHAFERFRQADGSTTRAHGGLGIGLAIVKELTELHGGQVDVCSDGPGRGATFTVTLPGAPWEPIKSGPELTRALASPLPSLSGVSVLAVDDNEEALILAAATLRLAGARVESANSAEQALAMWRRQPPDVLVCDLAMPGKGGIELLEELREVDARSGRATRAIALSAYASEDDQARTRAAGFGAHVTKPFAQDTLIRAVASVVSVS
jgi:signal transduction histidine kinase